MTDAPGLTFEAPPHAPLIHVEWWIQAAATVLCASLGGGLPAPGRAIESAAGRILRFEPDALLLRRPPEHPAGVDRLQDMIGDAGAATEISDNFVRLRIRGAQWRALLMIGAVFDAEAPTFAPGCVAASLIEHCPVRFDVLGVDVVETFAPPSYSAELHEYWRRAAARLAMAPQV